MNAYKCKMCGGTLRFGENQTVVVCEYCGNTLTLPKRGSDNKQQLLERANDYRSANNFDKAAQLYERVLLEDTRDAEIYWLLVLCTYGVEYVRDPHTHRIIPTVNRTQLTSVLLDPNYKKALEYADPEQKLIFEQEAQEIDRIQKNILAISLKEEPFDIFICYKETDASGKRTMESVLANEMYYLLQKEGYKVFFSRITLQDKIGSAYEPYIFSALRSAKVMVVLGTSKENFEATWVRNEWSRFLSMIKNGEKKVLIPAYRDIDPYDLPQEFAYLQALNMGSLGFMQDLIYGIKKIAPLKKIEPAPEPEPIKKVKEQEINEPEIQEDYEPPKKRTVKFDTKDKIDSLNAKITEQNHLKIKIYKRANSFCSTSLSIAIVSFIIILIFSSMKNTFFGFNEIVVFAIICFAVGLLTLIYNLTRLVKYQKTYFNNKVDLKCTGVFTREEAKKYRNHQAVEAGLKECNDKIRNYQNRIKELEKNIKS